MSAWDPYEFAPGAASFLAPPLPPGARAVPRRRGFLAGLGQTVSDKFAIEQTLLAARERYARYADPEDAAQIAALEKVLAGGDAAITAAVEDASSARRREAVRAIQEVAESRSSFATAFRNGIASVTAAFEGVGTLYKVGAGLAALYLVAQIAGGLGSLGGGRK